MKYENFSNRRALPHLSHDRASPNFFFRSGWEREETPAGTRDPGFADGRKRQEKSGEKRMEQILKIFGDLKMINKTLLSTP